MFDHRSPADELAHIRAEIARLKRREAQLREAYLTQPGMPRLGRWTKVEIVTHSRQIFEPRLLPEDIRLDPAFQREKVTRLLRTMPHARAGRHLPPLVASEQISAAPQGEMSILAAH
ncbi:MAG: hypothetical protein H5U24_04655 [Thioclava marina]|uniref:hypothetical protein n=1 Tax=Thioclava marina TaxID=1915077 RepID=UPI0019A388B7|nr:MULTISPECIES: hypothetical protein [Thioclava]MBC7144679.1 hypothetical protein [Thioclava marina]MBD3805243.1 hypothetical protein [Thioclava sp.]